MLFGQSVFQSVLDRLKADDEDGDAPEATASSRIHGFTTGLAFDVMEGVSVTSARPDQAYLDNLEFEVQAAIEKDPPQEPEPVMPEHLGRIAPHEVAAELAISSDDTVQSLGEKRRRFAKANHPDSVEALFRDNATRRMTVANLLIDEAVRRLNR
ncbi:hypothetical protein [Rhizobium sp. Root1220]|uniref:hypothetical protein n=1 Tax=Rhizobium sp. Root1220 TaxID=1736432 RepID=UPI0006FC1456|nr:hypothetical protein [Rhizobium sp. Root1220]KQV64618.1 hypothetical protein ASC90_17250 [Rhizobium sp. Root1220]